MKDLKWWQQGVIYQVYPRSFLDTDGDGNGNLRGIIEKMDYIASLGVDAIWLNPVNSSPMADNGYDISDYYQINPLFGTNEDMFELLDCAKKHGIRVIMDIVVNHCSDQHEWFKKALEDPEGEYGQYFYFRKGKDGKAPNNWRSVFGGSVWSKVPGTDYYYLHIFTPQQPDLNWENPKLRQEVYKLMNFWREKGAGGFRLDAISYIKKAEGLPSFEPDDEDGMVSGYAGSLNQPGILDLLRELKENTYGGTDCYVAGEVTGAFGESALPFISLENGVFSSIFDFSYVDIDMYAPNFFWCERRDWTPQDLKKALYHSHRGLGEGGWYSNAIENHDTPRAASRFLKPEGRNFYGKSMISVMYMLLRGTPLVYQGQELGMENYALPSIDGYDDVSTHNNYKVALEKGYSPEEALAFVQLQSRDNTRFPMCWTDGENGGFTTGTPWLPVSTDRVRINAAQQEKDPDSLLSFFKVLIGLRKDERYRDMLCGGSINPVFDEAENIVAYERIAGDRRALVVCNYQNTEAACPAEGTYKVLLDNYAGSGCRWQSGEIVEAKEVTMKPYQALVLEKIRR